MNPEAAAGGVKFNLFIQSLQNLLVRNARQEGLGSLDIRDFPVQQGENLVGPLDITFGIGGPALAG